MSDEFPKDMPLAPRWSIVFFWVVAIVGGIWWVLYGLYRFRVEEKLPP